MSSYTLWSRTHNVIKGLRNHTLIPHGVFQIWVYGNRVSYNKPHILIISYFIIAYHLFSGNETHGTHPNVRDFMLSAFVNVAEPFIFSSL